MQHTAATTEHPMTQPTQPSDTDRIIAAHREESRKTRVLLAWIFLGIPAVALVGWGVIAGLATLGHAQPSSTTSSVVRTFDTRPADPLPTGPLSNISDTTSCLAVTGWATDAAVDAYIGDHGPGGRAAFQSECITMPNELATDAKAAIAAGVPATN